jgi:hypothetical protein
MPGRIALQVWPCICRDCAPCRAQRVFIKRTVKRREKRAWQREVYT